jgi:transposase
VYAQDIKGFYYGEQSTLHIYDSPAAAERQRADLYRTVEVQEEKLSQLEQITQKDSKSYSAFFDINRKDTGEFTFERNYRRIDDAAKYAGFFCLLSSTGLSSREVLEAYRRKDMIENGFDDLKNHIDMKRLHTHTGAATDGKLFCAFIALIAISQMSACLGSVMSETSMDKDEVIAELEKIRAVFASGDRRLMNPATKTQKSILEVFGLNEESLKYYISSSLT